MLVKRPFWLNPNFANRFNGMVCSVEDPAGGAGAGGGAAAAGDADAKVKEIEARAKAAEEKAAKLEADAKKRADADKKAADEKAVAEGKAAELLKTREAELEAERKRLADYDARDKAEADRLFGKLTAAEQESAKLIKDALPTARYLDYLRTRIGDSATTAPPPGTPGSRGAPGAKVPNPLDADAVEMIESVSTSDTVRIVGEQLDRIKTSDGEKYTLSTPRFIQALKRRAFTPGQQLTPESASKLFASR